MLLVLAIRPLTTHLLRDAPFLLLVEIHPTSGRPLRVFHTLHKNCFACRMCFLFALMYGVAGTIQNLFGTAVQSTTGATSPFFNLSISTRYIRFQVATHYYHIRSISTAITGRVSTGSFTPLPLNGKKTHTIEAAMFSTFRAEPSEM